MKRIAKHLDGPQLVVRQFGPGWWEYHVTHGAQKDRFISGTWGEQTGYKTRRKAVRAGRRALKKAVQRHEFHKEHRPWREWEVVE